jgi:biopolymer transport protein ExbD
MPSVKIPRKSTDTDMTPFVDVAFLILSFFMLATKFKPPEPVDITTPNSVSTDKLKDNDAVFVEMDKDGRVFFALLSTSGTYKRQIIDNLDKTRGLGLTEGEKQNFVNSGPIGVPFSQLKSLLAYPIAKQATVPQPGIPVKDSASNELVYWIRDAVTVLAGRHVDYMIKGDNNAKYPDFKNVIGAFKRNDIYKFKLVTTPEEVPVGSDLYRKNQTK